MNYVAQNEIARQSAHAAAAEAQVQARLKTAAAWATRTVVAGMPATPLRTVRDDELLEAWQFEPD